MFTKKYLFFTLPLILAASTAYADDVLIKHPDFTISQQDLITELNSLPEKTAASVKNSPDKLRDYVDGFYREKAFEAQAKKQGLDNTPQFKQHLTTLYRKALAQALIDNKKSSITVPDMSALALTEYQGHPEKYQDDEMIEARHILLKATGADLKQKHEELAQLIKKIEQGESFEALAKQHSDDKGSAAKGGNLGAFKRGQMVATFEAAAFKLRKPNQLSDIVETPYGVHVIQLVNYKPAQLKPFDTVKPAIISELENEYIKRELDAWRAELIAPAKSEVNQEALDRFINAGKKP
ncbi:MAG: peptidylprolyl isomerase [Methylobacter sp.]|jgi:peptidyl-prolyl cis-trans isomerase C|nr:peptidylprolyl isomerase [Methylobacter sp.]